MKQDEWAAILPLIFYITGIEGPTRAEPRV